MLASTRSSRECCVYSACPNSESEDESSEGPFKEEVSRPDSTFTKGERPENLDSQVRFEEDMYDAVTVAAFGGVVLQLPSGCIKVHPVFMFVLCVPLFMSQQAALLYLRLGQDLDAPVHGEGVEGELQLILPFAKVLMIYTLALMLFPELLGALRLMMFLANPTTWTDIRRIDPATKEFLPWIWYPCCLAPVGFASEMLKFCVGYIVLVDSVSIVLVCRSVHDAIFNSLALTFLIELDNKLWEVAKSVFHLSFSTEKFYLRPREEREQASREAFLQFPEGCWLHRTNGASALEACLTSTVFMFCYCRQFLITEYSLRTDTLPMARDMCTLWELTEEDSWIGQLTRSTLRLFSLNVHPNDMLQRVCNPENGGYCSPKYRRIHFSDMVELTNEKPIATISNMVTFAVVLLIPQIFQLALHKEFGIKCLGGFLPQLIPDSSDLTAEDHEELKSQQLEEELAHQQQISAHAQAETEKLRQEVERWRWEIERIKKDFRSDLQSPAKSGTASPNAIRNGPG